MQSPHSRGFTIIELLSTVLLTVIATACFLPTMQSGRDKAHISQSVANLKNLSSANETYSGDWGDRQFTCVPDDAGRVQGDCATYMSEIDCPPQQLLGWDVSGAMWGYFIGSSGKCEKFGYPGNCGNWVVHLPIGLGGADAGYGAFRIPGLKAFHAYLNDRFYDPTLYAPKDVVPYNNISKYFTNAAEFTYNGSDGAYEDSSYCWSPAAMYDPKVFARNSSTLNGSGFTAPSSLAQGYRSPPVSRCKYPSLKTRMIEHNWLQKTPESATNPHFAGNRTPWFFNHGYDSSPASLFFDGHIELVECQRTMQAEQRAGKLWSRNTPLGAQGYYGAQSYDFLVKTSFHVLTTDGIEGRDVLGAEG